MLAIVTGMGNVGYERWYSIYESPHDFQLSVVRHLDRGFKFSFVSFYLFTTGGSCVPHERGGL